MVARNELLKYMRVNEVRGSFLDKPQVTDRVVTVVKNFQKVGPSKGLFYFCILKSALGYFFRLTPNAHLSNDLGLDSLDSVEIVMAFEEEFGFETPDNQHDEINSINLVVDFIASHPQAK
ncbi:hypothetical protein ACH5RR_018658 [Cinchona calisaya]|uniref:Acyl carrier protein n=1 Tax=Cinchona calisaya TaxID=153742 RepID=A0ABD2ZMJ4_9GENT